VQRGLPRESFEQNEVDGTNRYTRPLRRDPQVVVLNLALLGLMAKGMTTDVYPRCWLKLSFITKGTLGLSGEIHKSFSYNGGFIIRNNYVRMYVVELRFKDVKAHEIQKCSKSMRQPRELSFTLQSADVSYAGSPGRSNRPRAPAKFSVHYTPPWPLALATKR